MASIFLSHSSRDKPFAQRLAGDLRRHGHRVWFDEWVIRVGDSIPTKVAQGLEDHSFLGLVLTPHSIRSSWVTSEWEAKFTEEIKAKNVMVLPILAKRCSMPSLLRSRRYADFTRDYVAGLVELLLALRDRSSDHGIQGYAPDIVTIREDFEELIARSTTADLLVMYGATWRNTWRAALARMLRKRKSRLRVVLAAVDRDLELRRLYARRLHCSQEELLLRFRTAIREFSSLPANGSVEIYTTRSYLNHCLYLFDRGMVLGFYSYRERERTPAVITQDGDLQRWAREEFEGLLCSRRLLTRRIRPR
jgi:hypothetical protein